ncbi:hypothetical protein CDD83_6045 [Cordyceps sp. RAO-2017]|nr:hypothetical protein CDD83_6045 [Cordyceps sp. RAO-2017]
MQVGFSYDVATKGFLDLKTGGITPLKPDEKPPSNSTVLPGTFSSQNPESTANTTRNAARHFWNFMQVFSQDFLKSHPTDGTMAIWAESFGGHYGPVFARFIQDQNARVQQGSLPNAKVLNVTTVGIMNGCVDSSVEGTARPEMAFDKNTYGIRFISQEERDAAQKAFDQKDGCREKLLKCDEIGRAKDPDQFGNNNEVNEACSDADNFCFDQVDGAYFNQTTQRATFDLTRCSLAGSPGNEYQQYLTQDRVLKALGVPVNMTDFSSTCQQAFSSTGDGSRGKLDTLAPLLDSGVQVAMVYGDRDWICNWRGGERVSLAVKHNGADRFNRSGYTDVVIDGGQSVGQVRQHGLLSFTRVYQASHFASFSQPKAAFSIFDRAMQRRDIATGRVPSSNDYSTNGSPESTTTFDTPEPVTPTCELLGLSSTCSENQIEAVENKTAKIEKGVIVSPQLAPGTCP